MIRPLLPTETHLCAEGGKAFFDEGKLPGGFNPEVFCQTWSRLIEGGHAIILASFQCYPKFEVITGALGAILAPDLNNGHLLAMECFWFMLPEHRGQGLKLLRAYETWAKQRGAMRIIMVHLLALQPEKLGALYERMGYRAVETTYMKELSQCNPQEGK